jgi:general stress protein 26
MAQLTLSDIADKMKGIDVAILSTHTEGGEIAARPMSNNGDVKYDGDSYFFTSDDTLCVSDIRRNAKVGLGYSAEPGLFSGGVYISVEGDAELIRDKIVFQQHWNSDLDKWFKQGVDTPGLVLIKVHAHRIKCWDGYESTEVRV